MKEKRRDPLNISHESAVREGPDIKYILQKRSKDHSQELYDLVSKELNSTIYGEYAYFLNWGYIANENPEYSQIELPKNYLNKNTVKLVLELVGDCNLTGCNVLDVGCGRGGTIYVIDKYFSVKRLIGLDLSGEAIAFCNKTLSSWKRQFIQGDAEKLPFPDGSFDIITNVESSHAYPDIKAFYGEVYRVLSSGYFLYTDLFRAKEVDMKLTLLQNMGLIIERNQDITSNVLLSCDEVSRKTLAAFKKSGNGFVAAFLGTPGSKLYNGMKEGELTYRILRLRKP